MYVFIIFKVLSYSIREYQMANSRSRLPEGQDSVQGDNNNHLLESTLARMANYFERQEGRLDRGERIATDIPNDVILERFQKFRPPRFSG